MRKLNNADCRAALLDPAKVKKMKLLRKIRFCRWLQEARMTEEDVPNILRALAATNNNVLILQGGLHVRAHFRKACLRDGMITIAPAEQDRLFRVHKYCREY
jgi:hypothetical protein